ncbi:UDP-2,3-diacylglucosamine diphosphatase [Candidatus Blochmannia ocreatus (nom. nud.)]|uniref:UDP-2,3-diacylglucosamine hydrolase n=1 Tax=Candidatus Blochmannia ocreatus (nom. nud.) TaxID=251538 RepID=A0ABY4STS0_9ENTR|nr:UDP-2,3-diacylglucosamine diphosphatase [Candidatus Blochmannia ocreatus]URJ25364.1 UDP-2,3-diacylglucosamine diphosphatase [Candidatus Blochmannia ocreatus]
MSLFFISDVHLCMRSPDVTNGFLYFLKHQAIRAQALYILGDLFEIWLGDDDNNLLHIDVANALKELNKKIPCYFIHGNHDFLLGRKYAESCGMILLPAEKVLKLASGIKIIILHGDILCVNDRLYQLFRKFYRNILIQKLFLLLPLTVRLKIFNFVRFWCIKCRKIKNKPKNSVSISLKLAIDMLIANRADVMIHGHTHKPVIYKICKSKTDTLKIIALGKWNKYGSMIKIDEKNNSIIFLKFPLNVVRR